MGWSLLTRWPARRTPSVCPSTSASVSAVSHVDPGSASCSMRAARWVVWPTAVLREDSDRLQDEDQQGGPQHCHNPAHDGAARGQSEYAGEPEAQARADDADHDVGYGAHLRVRLHEHAGQPTHDGAHDQRDDPVHALSSSIFVRRPQGLPGAEGILPERQGPWYWTLFQHQTPAIGKT